MEGAVAPNVVVPLNDKELRQHTLLQQEKSGVPMMYDDQRSVDSSTGAAYRVPMHASVSAPSVGRWSVISDVKADIYDCDADSQEGNVGRTQEEEEEDSPTSSPLHKTTNHGSQVKKGSLLNRKKKKKKPKPDEIDNEIFWTSTNRRIALFLVVLFVIVAAAIVVVVILTKPNKDNNDESTVPPPRNDTNNATTTGDGGDPVNGPAPLYTDDAVQYIQRVLVDITNQTYQSSRDADTAANVWEDPTSSQVRARDWIIYQDTFLLSQQQVQQQQRESNQTNNEEEEEESTGWIDRLLQRYALVQLYFATEGRLWAISDTVATPVDFANPTTSECTWTGVTCDDTKRRRYLKLLPRIDHYQVQNFDDYDDGNPVHRENPMGLHPYHHHHHHPALSSQQHRSAMAILSREFGDQDPLQMSRLLQEDTTNYYGSDGAMNRVFRLFFHRTNLTGTIPNELGRCLPQLYELDLSQNRLHGTIPFSLFTPETKWDTSLYWLDLSDNNFKGSIPSNIWTLHELQFLFLYENRLTGRIERHGNDTNAVTPPTDSTNNETISGGKRSNLLKQIQLYNNFLTGSIPDWFQELSDLEQFVVFENELTGPLPDPVPASLIVFDVSFNEINGTIPIKLWSESDSPTHIERLYLDHNQLSGTLPNSTQLRQDMQRLWLNDNYQLTGTIPENFGRAWSRLSELQLHHTALTGRLGPDNTTSTMEDGTPVDNCHFVWPNLTVMKANCLQRMTTDVAPVDCECCTLCESVDGRKRRRQRQR